MSSLPGSRLAARTSPSSSEHYPFRDAVCRRANPPVVQYTLPLREVVRRRAAADNPSPRQPASISHQKPARAGEEGGRCSMFEIANSNQSAPAAEAIGMDAHSSSLQRELAATAST